MKKHVLLVNCPYCGEPVRSESNRSVHDPKNFFCSPEHHQLYLDQEEAFSWENELKALKELYPEWDYNSSLEGQLP